MQEAQGNKAASDPGDPTVSTTHGLRYRSIAILLHWLTAAAFAFQIGLGWQMGDPGGPGRFAAYQLHKSVGITILLLTLVRVCSRLAYPAPPLPPTLRPIERRLARVVHVGFYVVLLSMPLSGWLIVSTSATAIPTYLFGTLFLPHVPVPAALHRGVNSVAGSTHLLLAWIAIAMIALHVLGALKHQVIDRDEEFGRMVPGPRAALPWLAVGLPLAVIVLMAVGRTVTPSPPRLSVAPAPAASPVAPATEPPLQQAPTPPAIPVSPSVSAKQAAPATPSSWTVRRKDRRIGFRTAWSQGTVDGSFGSWSATIAFDPSALEKSSVKVTVDLASATTSAADQQAALSGEDWFATALHPQATFRAIRFRSLGGDRYRADGTLTLRGVSRPQRVDFTLRIVGDVATVSGSARVDRTAFGVGQGAWASTADLPAVVQLSIRVTADRVR